MEENALGHLRKFVAPEYVFGCGARQLVGRYARNLGARRVLVVTDEGLIATGWADEICRLLTEEGLEYTRFSEITPNPKDHEVAAGVEVYRKEDCNAIVALGGGSPMDCAKGIGILSTNEGSIYDFEGVDQVSVPCPPLIFIPSTAGTAADISQFAIVTHAAEKYKMAIISKAVVPDVSLTDPEVTLTMDCELTACTGLDALTHAIEALVSNANSPITDLHALDAIRLISAHLLPVLNKLDDMEHRTGMMLASLQAGLAFSNASLGAVHAMAHSLGGLKDLPHGECNAILLPYVVDFNFEMAREGYEKMGAALGLDLVGQAPAQRRETIVGALLRLQKEAGIDGGLTRLGVTPDDIAELARRATQDACLVTNPRPAEQHDLEAIYERAA
ncbi:MAG: iron-containing alcohol dehydrogenase [Candidatus Eisenbacteria sp.]|nr:iron-containing alcohol dehydrogenase [Candidatus Eisenbacteria bacterium]